MLFTIVADFIIQGGSCIQRSVLPQYVLLGVSIMCALTFFCIFELVSYFFFYRVEKSDTKILILGSQVFR